MEREHLWVTFLVFSALPINTIFITFFFGTNHITLHHLLYRNKKHLHEFSLEYAPMEPGPRWKGKGFMDIAHAKPMSHIVAQLQSSLTHSEAYAILSGSCDVLFQAEPQLADLLDRTYFGSRINNAEKQQWFQFAPEEAFYLHYSLHCLKIIGENETVMTAQELWTCMNSTRRNFARLYKAYAHLRSKNWVVRSGTQFGVDFVAYRHHPALVHSEFAVLVLSEDDADSATDRLKAWSDLQCTVRVCGGVAKTLLILNISGTGCSTSSPLCLEQYNVEERKITRWLPEQSREDHTK